jgi:hypothetical protein
MSPCKHDPCIFTGRPIDGEPPLYLSVYVYDFTYFLDSNKVKRAFEQALSVIL